MVAEFDVFLEVLDLPGVNILGVDFSGAEIIIEVECTTGEVKCPDCGTMCDQVHDVVEKKIRDQSLSGKRCLLKLHHRRFYCPACNRSFMERLSWLDQYERCTKRYAKWIKRLGKDYDVACVSRIEQVGYKTVERILFDVNPQTLISPETIPDKLGIDEFSYAKGKKDYGVVLGSRNNIIQVLPSRKEPVLRRFFSSIKNEIRERVHVFTMDMWNTFINLAEEFFPNASIVIDRFHVMKHMNKAVDKVRKAVQKQQSEAERKELKGLRWVLLKNKEDLNEEETQLLKKAFTYSVTLHKVHLRKEEFRCIFEKNTDKKKATKQLEQWMQKASTIKHRSMSTFLKTLNKRKEYILNYFNHHDNNGFMEGIMNKVKLIKRKAYGMTNFAHLAQRIILAFNTPTP